MSEIISFSVDLSKIDKSKIKLIPCADGHTGKFVDLTVFINDQLDKFNNIASITMGQTKEEREAKAPKVYIGNGKRTWTSTATSQPDASASENLPSDDLPF